MITLERAQLGQGKRGLDITVKSCKPWLRPLAPTWDMVLQGKSGGMAQEKYTEHYLEILSRVEPDLWTHLQRLGREHGGLRFLCYCPDGAFCHTHLLIDFLLEWWPTTYRDGRLSR